MRSSLLVLALADGVGAKQTVMGRPAAALLGAARVRLQHAASPVAKHAPPLALMPLVIPGVWTFSDAALFPCVNLVMPAWLLLILLPRWKHTKTFVKATALAFAVLYVALFIPLLGASGSGGYYEKMMSLAGLTELFAEPSTVFHGWIHYVVFDLWTAQYIVTDAAKIQVDRYGNLWRIPHLAVVPCLLATMLAGPAGLLAYFSLRGACVAYRKSSFNKRPGSY